MRLKTFGVWLALVCMSALVVPTAMFRFYGKEEASPTYSLGIVIFILGISMGLAAFGTIAVWILPTRRIWLGITGGVVAAIGSLALAAWIAIIFYGGFENNIAIFVGALSLAPGSCLAGIYAGFLRSRENQALRGESIGARLKSEN
jgi:predicted lysophospholipase L1 biosynthesis ABC-type transport system permease subunit